MPRNLSLNQAQNCEDAREPRCRCRCSGLLHGAARGMTAAFFASLPEDDPHHIPTKEARAAKRRAERQRVQERRHQAIADLFAGGSQAQGGS